MIDLEDIGSSGPKLIRTDTIIATSNYNKPGDVLSDDLVLVDVWSGGQGGGRGSSAGSANGGFPGVWFRLRVWADELPAITSAIVGAGGAGAITNVPYGDSGGASGFLGFLVPGGNNSTLGSSSTILSQVYKRLMDASMADVNSGAPFRLIYPVVDFDLPYLLDTSAAHGNAYAGSNDLGTSPVTNLPGFGGNNQSLAGQPGYLGQPSVRGGSGGNGSNGSGVSPVAGGIRGGGGGAGIGMAGASGGRGEILIRYYRGASR